MSTDRTGKAYKVISEGSMFPLGTVVYIIIDDRSDRPGVSTEKYGPRQYWEYMHNLEEIDAMDALKAGDILVKKDARDKDHYQVVGTYEKGGATLVAVIDIYDGSKDLRPLSLDQAKRLYVLKGTEPEVTEFTLEQIAEKMGVPVEQIRIKE